MKLRFTLRAAENLADIADYIHARNPSAARRVREHHCGCGFVATRDQAAALSMLVDGFKLLGREPAWAAGPETPSKAA